MDRNAVASIGKPMAFRHLAAEDEHRDIDARAGDGDFSSEVVSDGFGDGRAGFAARRFCNGPNMGLSCAMRVIAISTLKSFWERHPDSEQPLKAWYDEAKHARWMTPQHIKTRYASASFVGKNRVVFNIKGNDYRLVVAVAYRFQAVYIKFVGTHAQYGKIDAATVEDS
jgi:mRNA interferase HigB